MNTRVSHVFRLQYKRNPGSSWETLSSWLDLRWAQEAQQNELGNGDTYHGGIVPPLRILSVVTVESVV